jgi:hypothetical protein
MKEKKNWISSIARVGLTAKGVVYLILGILAFMAAFELGGQSDSDANRKGVFNFIKDGPAGIGLLVLLCAGLVCYSIWRVVEAFARNSQLKWPKRLRYLFSGLAYLSAAFTALQIILHTSDDGGDRFRDLAARLMQSTYGTWLVGAAALLIAGVGVYQIWYGLSEKYKKHVQRLSNAAHHSVLLYSGKIGYTARGVVWLIIAYLLLQAAVHANAAKAGDSSKAFQFIEQARFGSYLLGALGLGLIAYGIFNFIRARYETFQQ